MKNFKLTPQTGAFILVTFVDFATTLYSSNKILGVGIMSRLFSLLFAVGVAWALIDTAKIIRDNSANLKNLLTKIGWGLAALYDLGTTFKGVFDLLQDEGGNAGKLLLTIFITLCICFCPIKLSYILYHIPEE